MSNQKLLEDSIKAGCIFANAKVLIDQCTELNNECEEFSKQVEILHEEIEKAQDFETKKEKIDQELSILKKWDDKIKYVKAIENDIDELLRMADEECGEFSKLFKLKKMGLI